ncbi:hypothetical protein HHK36_027843 [Tetracentron sinense]|uniref:Uncharacterized protein n=1 Tax=Tetracentron sinense TaxID=13715 RepID=A0A834YEQ2_TETSI|nr:hypothetical protein HHK36_027843 [Tetracentron sinense]
MPLKITSVSNSTTTVALSDLQHLHHGFSASVSSPIPRFPSAQPSPRRSRHVTAAHRLHHHLLQQLGSPYVHAISAAPKLYHRASDQVPGSSISDLALIASSIPDPSISGDSLIRNHGDLDLRLVVSDHLH